MSEERIKKTAEAGTELSDEELESAAGGFFVPGERSAADKPEDKPKWPGTGGENQPFTKTVKR